LSVTGDVRQPLKLQLDDLKKLHHVKVALKEHDGSIKSYQGAPLGDVLAMAGVVTGDHIKGKALAICVEVTASDGYAVALGLGETEPTISGKDIILGYAVDGQPLGAGVGPIRLVIGDDKKQARCVRMVTGIRVTDLSKEK
jgi:DMSO/TMAO reductase YedYZ molybdopterin-dependent catalytic subunit